MRIKFVTDYREGGKGGSPVRHTKGEELDLPAEQAKPLLKSGAAVRVLPKVDEAEEIDTLREQVDTLKEATAAKEQENTSLREELERMKALMAGEGTKGGAVLPDVKTLEKAGKSDAK